jgi:hypothetical protein
VFHFQGADRVAVDEHLTRSYTKLADGSADRQSAGVIDVEAIDLSNRSRTEPDADGSRDNLDSQVSSLGSANGLGVSDPVDGGCIRVHDDGACDNGARERAPSDFIHSSEKEAASGAKFTLHGAPPHQALAACAVAGLTLRSLIRVALPVSARR